MEGYDDPINSEQAPLLGGQDRRVRRKRAACAIWCIYITEVLERAAFYSLIGNLIFLLNRVELNWSSANAATLILLTNGVSYVSSFVAGIIATYCTGKFTTTAIAFVFYLVGYSVYPFLQQTADNDGPSFATHFSRQLSSLLCHNSSAATQLWRLFSAEAFANDSSSVHGSSDDPFVHQCKNSTDEVQPLSGEMCFGAVASTLTLIGLAVGGVKANLVPLGVDQCGGSAERTRRFVNNFYWSTNAGAAVAYLGIIYVQQAVSIFVGLFIPLCLLLVASFIFVLGRCCFAPDQPTDASPSHNLSIICYLFRRRACCDSRRRTLYPHDELTRQAAPSSK